MKTVFLTGVSSGIGRASAVDFLKRGDRVIGTVRDLKAIVDLCNEYPNFIPFQIDLLNLNQISKTPEFLTDKNIQSIDLLINNAGIAIAAPFEFQKFDEIIEIVQINIISVMKLSQVLIPYLKKSDSARIINISSVSGKNGTPFLAAYCAAKHALEGFSESLRRELNIYGIKVILVGPGSVKTPIWDKGFEKIKFLYSQTIFQKSFDQFIAFAMNEKNNALDVQIVVDDIMHASFSNYPKIRYEPVPNKILDWVLSVIPKRWNDQLNYRILGLNQSINKIN